VYFLGVDRLSESCAKKILLGVSAGIAAYKAADLVSQLRKLGYAVRVLMTPGATKFVAPITFQALSGEPVLHDLAYPQNKDAMDHIRLAEEADLFILAPATANLIGRLAHGLADDIVTTTTLAYAGPILFAPAMNTQMYQNPIVQKNIQTLVDLGFHAIGPGEGSLACGTVGLGRMAEPDEILRAAKNLLANKGDFDGYRILITAGPTQEPLDRVRYLTNYSSGKMGYALARAACQRGAEVTLVSGPTHLEKPSGVHFIPVQTAREMYEAVIQQKNQDAVIMAAAVSDFSFVQNKKEKMNKKDFSSSLEIQTNPDILAELAQKRQKNGSKDQVLIGFSMETQNLIKRSQEKLKIKKIDLMIANSLKDQSSGFQVDTNQVSILDPEGKVENWPLMSKSQLADRILNRVKPLFPKR
jgi:phosphopantothenoylcysteine decarboxylase/phosphopantothenate--cysteine ligase